MADSIEKHILNQASFFAIGAGHLPGSTGVISQLRNKGFTLKPVKSKNRISLLIVNEMMKFASEKNEGVKDIEVVEEPPPPPPPPLPTGIEMQKVEIKKVEKPAPKKKTKQ